MSKKMVYYYLDLKVLKENAVPMVLNCTEERIDNYVERFLAEGRSAVEFYCEKGLPNLDRLVYDSETRLVRPATEQEKYNIDKDKYVLKPGDYIKHDVVKTKPQMPYGLFKPNFNIDTEEWEETATADDLAAYKETIRRQTYHSELDKYRLLKTEVELGIRSEDELNEVVEYLRALAEQVEDVKRPDVLYNYDL